MLDLRNNGLTYNKIGSIFSLSRQRIHQILKPRIKKPMVKKPMVKKLTSFVLLKEKRVEDPDYNSAGIVLEGQDRVREIIRRRDNWTCQICGKKWKESQRRFDVHHIDCKKEKSKQYDIWEKEKNNMITLCHKCHLNIPEHRRKMLRNFRINNYQQASQNKS